MFKLSSALVLAGTAAVLTTACGWEKMTLEDCLADAGRGFKDSIPPELAGSISDEQLEEAIDPLCEEFVRTPDSSSMDDEAMRRFLSRVFREKPELYEPICRLAIDAEFAAYPAEIRYVTQQERATFRRDACRLQVEYMQADSPLIDYGRLIRDHPDYFAPFCAAGIQLAFDEDPWIRDSFSAREKSTIARRTCAEALETGVIDASGPGGLRSPSIDQQAFCALLGKVTRQVAKDDVAPASSCGQAA